jgi:hypothetical protein
VREVALHWTTKHSWADQRFIEFQELLGGHDQADYDHMHSYAGPSGFREIRGGALSAPPGVHRAQHTAHMCRDPGLGTGAKGSLWWWTVAPGSYMDHWRLCSVEVIPHVAAVISVSVGIGGITIMICIGLWLRRG